MSETANETMEDRERRLFVTEMLAMPEHAAVWLRSSRTPILQGIIREWQSLKAEVERLTEWIPVEKSLPDFAGVYDVTLSDGSVDIASLYLPEREPCMRWADSWGEPIYVIAWRERPAPYQPEG